MGPEFADPAEIDHRRAMDPLKNLRIELRLQLFHRGPQDVGFAGGVHTHIVTRGVDPIDVGAGYPQQVPTRPDREHLRITPIGSRDALKQGLGIEFSGASDIGEQREHSFMSPKGVSRSHRKADALQRLSEAVIVHWLKQVIEGAGLEGVDGVSVIGGHKDDDGHRVLWQVRDDVQTRQPGHLDIQKDRVGRQRRYLGNGIPAIGTLTHHFDVGRCGQAKFESTPCQPLIIDEQDADFHDCNSAGKVSSMTHPCSRLRPANRACGPYRTLNRSRVFDNPTPRPSAGMPPSGSPGPSSEISMRN